MLLLFFATGTPAIQLVATEARDITVYDTAVLLFIINRNINVAVLDTSAEIFTIDRNVNVASHDTSVEVALRKTITQ